MHCKLADIEDPRRILAPPEACARLSMHFSRGLLLALGIGLRLGTGHRCPWEGASPSQTARAWGKAKGENAAQLLCPMCRIPFKLSKTQFLSPQTSPKKREIV